MLISRNRYDPFEVLTIVKGWNREDPEPAPLWARVAITEPGGRTVEVDTPSGWTLADWQAYAPSATTAPGAPSRRSYRSPSLGLGHRSTLMRPCAPLARGVAGITVEVFRSLLCSEDIKDIEAGGIPPKTLHAYAQSFAEGIRSGRVVP